MVKEIMGVSEEPLIISPTMTNLPEGYNIQTLQTVTLEETNSATQYQTLITVPFTEILVLDQSQVKTLLTPDVQLVVADASGQSQIVNESMVIYVPQEVNTNDTEQEADTQVASLSRQWYQDSLVATQALSSLTQALTQVFSEGSEETNDSPALNPTEAKENISD